MNESTHKIKDLRHTVADLLLRRDPITRKVKCVPSLIITDSAEPKHLGLILLAEDVPRFERKAGQYGLIFSDQLALCTGLQESNSKKLHLKGYSVHIVEDEDLE